MNIFYTHSCPVQAADELCYKHVVKMILESCQLLSTAHHVMSTELDKNLIYKMTHKNHPSAVWVRKSVEHYDWVWLNAKRMCEIYTAKTGRTHASEGVLDLLLCYPTGLPQKPFVEPPACVDDDLKHLSRVSTEHAYQVYLNRKFSEWLNRDRPLKVEFPVKAPIWYEKVV